MKFLTSLKSINRHTVFKIYKLICIFLHIYYPDSLPDLLKVLHPLLNSNNYLLINLVQDTHLTMPDLPKHENIIIVRSPNKGKDVGGKLLLLDLYLRLGIKSEYMIFLHDKKSPHSSIGNFWKSELYKIVDEKMIASIRSLFRNKKRLGIIASKKFIRNEWHVKAKTFDTTNNTILLSLLKTYQFSLTDYSFVAGTMFWVRSSIYVTFFSQHAPLTIRTRLEGGDVLDTEEGSFTHSWERMLSWIATERGYKLYGI